MTEKLSLGFVGLGYWGVRLARAAVASGESVVAGGFARSPVARRSFVEEFGGQGHDDLASLLASDIDAVVIATPIATHADIAVQAARAGRHVLVEKPITLDVAAARRIVQAADDAGVLLQVGHQRRRRAATRRVGGLAASGALGRVHSMEATIFNADGLFTGDSHNRRDSWKFDPAQRVLGAMTQQGVHMIDNMQYIAGQARRVAAFGTQVVPDGQGIDVAALLVEYDSGPVGVISNSSIGTWVATFTVHGTNGSAWSEDDGARFFHQGIDQRSRSEEPIDPVDALVDQMRDFATCVRDGRRPETDGTAGLEVVAVLQAAALSAERGVAVDVAEVREGGR